MAPTTAAPIITPAATQRGRIRLAADCRHLVAEDQAHHCGCGDTTCGEPRCLDDHLAVCVEGAALEAFYATH